MNSIKKCLFVDLACILLNSQQCWNDEHEEEYKAGDEGGTGVATFAFFDINPRPLDDELVKNNILLKRVFDAVKFACLRLSCRCWSLAKGAIQLHKMRTEAMNAKVARIFCKVGVISVGGQF